MTSASDIRAIAAEARPAIKKWLDAAELITGFREAATEKGLNWSALKAVIVASIKDEEDGGDRVKKLAEKADESLTYADALGNKIKFREEPPSPAPHKSPPVSVSVAAVRRETTNTPSTANTTAPIGDGAAGTDSHPLPAATLSVAESSPPACGDGGAGTERPPIAAPSNSDDVGQSPKPVRETDSDFNDIPPHLRRPFPNEARA